MILYIDTATTGGFAYKEANDAAIQPHICRLSALLTEENGDEALSYSRLIEPRAAWTFEPAAIIAHGISRHIALEQGQPLAVAWKHFRLMQDEARLLVAFNWDHHRRVLLRTAIDAKDTTATFPLLRDPGAFCAMREAAPMVGKPRQTPGGGFAWPKMPEAYTAATGEPLPPRHADAAEQGLAMVRAIRRIHEGIQRHGAVKG